ncbi:hypothetical protein [Streptosporangium carneum]|uniref:Outer membrane channel protein CpnT-like N-terminal domain-containing protein n=1 Tax=Streptosporangium carneum TaxID=47481 RepID=A0A9W6HVU1_9ACTN|nr:hypothetical protein [Streptosporangium carneum]GLK07232.1 hypothetical protein GCM10017600_06370 [Streptosporangium carneum]
MGVTVPPQVDAMLGLLGVPWPNVDEDEIRKDADAWRTVLAHAEPAAAEADATIRRTKQNYRGDSATALASHWDETGGNGGHLSQAANAARTAPVVLDNAAWLTTGVKLAVGTAAVYASVRVARAFLAGGPFGGAAASAEMYRTRAVIGRIQREGAEGAGRVLAPALNRRVTEQFRRVLDNLRRPGGPPLALAGAGGRVPIRTVGPRAAAGPRSPRDGMALMGRSNNNARAGGNGRRGGGRRSGGSGGNANGGRRSGGDEAKSGHAEIRQVQRGISDDMIEQARRSPGKPGNTKGTKVHESQRVRVVVNSAGKVVSAMWRR